jgi:hypothetical protein
MSQAKTAFVLLVVFFAGCAAERLLVVPPARAGTNPQRWEYFCKDMSGDPDVNKAATLAGQQGWELAAAGNTDRAAGATWCFKRPLP